MSGGRDSATAELADFKNARSEFRKQPDDSHLNLLPPPSQLQLELTLTMISPLIAVIIFILIMATTMTINYLIYLYRIGQIRMRPPIHLRRHRQTTSSPLRRSFIHNATATQVGNLANLSHLGADIELDDLVLDIGPLEEDMPSAVATGHSIEVDITEQARDGGIAV